MSLYKSLLKPLLFMLRPERAHHLTMHLFGILLIIPGMKSILGKMFKVRHMNLSREVFGLKFPNPVGLAAGFDKDARYVKQMEVLGFGFLEIGTVTPRPQPGNPRPRLFRLPKSDALINRMGFNNQGVGKAAERLLKYKNRACIIGGNIGKNKDTVNEHATEDYLTCFEALYPFVDYFAVNVSSPNTPGLRALQAKGPLLDLLGSIQKKNLSMPSPKPVLLKIAPDLTREDLDDILEIVGQTGIAGIVATNTTISREGLSESGSTVRSFGEGGLSGAPLKAKSTEIIRYLHEKSGGNIPIIGIGGISDSRDAIEKLEAGASLVQVYTGLIYEGPGMVKKILTSLVNKGT